MRDVRELRAAGAGALIVGAYMLLVLSTGRVQLYDFARLLGVYLQTSLSLWLFLGLSLLLIELYRKRPRDGPGPNPAAIILSAAKSRWERDRFVSLFWPPLLFATLMASFNAFKQMVLPLAGFGLDPAFAQADKLLFFGQDPWRVTHALLGSPQATLLIDRAYHGWFVPMSLGVMLCGWLSVSTYHLRNQYLLSYIGVWVGIGSIAAFLMPSAGPCYYETFMGPYPSFAELKQQLLSAEAATGAKLSSLSNQAGLLRLFGGDSLAVGAGISAMPSVHNALALLFAIAGWKVSRILGVLFAVYAALIWIGSIHLGWHYAIDGLLAAAMVGFIWVGAGRLVERFERGSRSRQAEAALA
ncbi:MAG: phosphatase PAP2 family protein [Alphaproteobacteria bacterium]